MKYLLLFILLTDLSIAKSTLENYGDAELDSINQSRLSLLVWNVHKGVDERFRDDIKSLGQSKDLVLIQEGVFSNNFINTFLNIQSMFWTSATSFLMPYDDYQKTGVMTGGRFRPVNSKFIRTKILEVNYFTPKITLFNYYKIENSKDLLVVNSHLINFVVNSDFLYELDRIKDVMSLHIGPIIFAGDMNTWNITRLNGLSELQKKLGLKNVEFEDSAVKKVFGNKLDHVLYRGLELAHIENLNSIKSSDHFPLAVEFIIE